jgi:GT2 family glycosyltransferase
MSQIADGGALRDANTRRSSGAGTVTPRADSESQANHAANGVPTIDPAGRHRELETALRTTVAERDALAGRVASLEAALAQSRSRAEAAEDHVARLLESHSWRVTAPLRRGHDFIALPGRAVRLRRAAAQCAYWVYRNIPLPAATKRRLRDLLFTVGGRLFAGTAAYKRWKMYRGAPKLKMPGNPHLGAADPGALTAAGETAGSGHAPLLAAGAPSLWTADGQWEWQDYEPTRRRLAEKAATTRRPDAVVAPRLVKADPRRLLDDAAKIRLERPAEPAVSIIVPVYNNKLLTFECLKSVAEARCAVSFEVIVADDASTDGTEDLLARIEHLLVVRHAENLGFLRTCNAAIQHARGEYVVFLNNDVQVCDGWLDALVETFSTQPRAGAVGPKLVYPSGHLQEAGAALNPDGSVTLIGLNEAPDQPRFSYARRVDYCSGACLMVPRALLDQVGGFSDDFAPCYCEDLDLCLKVREAGYFVYVQPAAEVVHHLSKTMNGVSGDFKLQNVYRNLAKISQRWQDRIDAVMDPRLIAFYLPQFHPFPENDRWWGRGFTEWTNVSRAQPNFIGHYQPRLPADLGFYDLRVPEVLEQQAELAQRYGIHGFCFYYYWFAGRRLLDLPVERMLASGRPQMPFCMCWANENWTRRWDGEDRDILIGQAHSPEDDEAVIRDLIRYFRDPRYIRIDGRPLLLVYRVTLFPDFARTAALWRDVCRTEGIGEIYLAMVESFELVLAPPSPTWYGCDASVEFPPQQLAEQRPPSGPIVNPQFQGAVADYRELAVRYAFRAAPPYTRFRGVMPGWDNTARMQNRSFCFEHATPGAFQAWLEEMIRYTREQYYGDERLIFINAWNEWAEGAYLEPDRRFGHTFLEAIRNALDAARLLRSGVPPQE